MSVQGLLLIACLFITLTTQAADRSGSFAIKGAGLMTCQQVVSSQKTEAAMLNLYGWLDGYLSAYNAGKADTFDVAPWQSADLLQRLIARHCQSHPDARLMDVARAVIARLERERLRERQSLVLIQAGKTGLLIYPEIIRRAQKALQGAGFYRGPVDGNYSQETRAAVLAYQKRNKLKVTGLADPATLWRLFYPPRVN